MAKKGKLKVNKAKVNSICSQIEAYEKEINAQLNKLESSIADMEKNVWHGGTRSVATYKNLRDSIVNSRKVMTTLDTVNVGARTAASIISSNS